ncbi:MAG: formylglycine-generating enzyme family protein [Pirellulales bacterium]|nr:formylglycine-generating enzyme family protein [Pirellulales bacterium]
MANFIRLAAFLSWLTSILTPITASAITIPTVPVGNPGNAPDLLTGNHYGAVSYDYRIGTTEVTNAQYAEFLNFKAATGALTLWTTSMDSDARGGITRSGVSGSYSYTTKPNMADKPVNFVFWYSAIRFANWLHNGQGAGDTETGAYTLLGGTTVPTNFLTITRNAGATWFLPSENEWYKAAYYDPRTATEGGPAGDDHYWLYPTMSDSAPAMASADVTGNISNPGTNVANYDRGADWNSQDGNVTTVGSAGPLSRSFYGTSDQGGNLWEWNEALLSPSLPSIRGTRGGAFADPSLALQSSARPGSEPGSGFASVGFRVAIVPEPSTLALGCLGLAAAALFLFRRARRPSLPRVPAGERS